MKDNCNKIRINISTGLLNLTTTKKWKGWFQLIFTREICFWISASSSFSGRNRANGWCWSEWYIVLRTRIINNDNDNRWWNLLWFTSDQNLRVLLFSILMNHWTWNDIDTSRNHFFSFINRIEISVKLKWMMYMSSSSIRFDWINLNEPIRFDQHTNALRFWIRTIETTKSLGDEWIKI